MTKAPGVWSTGGPRPTTTVRSDGEPGLGRVALGAGLAAAVVVAFVYAEWHVAGFRRAMGWLAPRLSFWLYVAAGVAILGSLVLRFLPAATATALKARLRPTQARAGFLAFPAVMAGSIMAFLVPLFGTWATGLFRPPLVVAGVLPFSDGALWFGGAERLLFNGFIDDYAAKRPLNPALFAVRLATTHLDFRLAMVLDAVLLGFACALLARVVARHLGRAAALALFAAIFSFVGLWVPLAMTESLGVAFGALAVAALWSALHDSQPRLFAAGLFLLTVAQCIRPGAVAVVLLLPLWFARSARRDSNRLVDWPVLRLGLAAVVAGVAVNLAASFATGGNPAHIKSNTPYMLYALARGHPGWDAAHPAWGLALGEHTELYNLDDSARSVLLRRITREAIRDDPARFASALLRSEVNYLRLAKSHTTAIPNVTYRRVAQAAVVVIGALSLRRRRRREGWRPLLIDVSLFGSALLCLPVYLMWSFVAGIPPWFGGGLALASFVAFVLVGSARLIGRAQSRFLLVAMAGIVVSLPVIGFDNARVLAATAPLMALPLAMAASVLARGRPGMAEAAGGGVDDAGAVAIERSTAPDRSRWSPAVAGGALVAVALLGGPLAAAAVDKPRATPGTCPGAQPAQVLLGASTVRVVKDVASSGIGVDAIDVETASSLMERVYALDAVKVLVQSGTTIASGIDEQGNDRIVFLTGSVPHTKSSVLYFCGERFRPEATALLNILYPKPFNFGFMTGTPLVE